MPLIAATHGLLTTQGRRPDDRVQAVGDGSIAVVSNVEVDQRGAGRSVSHAFHQLAQCRTRFRREGVAGVSQVVQTRRGSATRCSRAVGYRSLALLGIDNAPGELASIGILSVVQLSLDSGATRI